MADTFEKDKKMKVIKGVSEILNNYDFFIFDLWGVVHDGFQAFPGTLDVFKLLRENGKLAGILSNAPRRIDNTILRLKEMSIIDGHDYQVILTSGQQCYDALINKTESFYQALGNTYYHPGPQRDFSSYQDIPYTRVDHLEDADFRLFTSILKEDMSDTLDDYRNDLVLMLKKDMPLVCANADKRVLWGKQEVMCIGLIAEEYARLGGRVMVHGKPSITVFRDLHAKANHFKDMEISKNRILMIGDSLGTDIKGANDYGIDSLLVASGIHGEVVRGDGLGALEPLMEMYESKPTYFDERVRQA